MTGPQLRELACSTLLAAGIRRLPVHIKAVAHGQGASVFTYSQYADVADCSLDQVARQFGSDGFTQRLGERCAIFYYEAGNLCRIRWTLAHELGHILLGHLSDQANAPEAEQVADALAAELLCPTVVVQACGCGNSPAALARLCDISPAAAACRARQLAHSVGELTPGEGALLVAMSGFITEYRTQPPVEGEWLPLLRSHRL